MKNPFKNRPWLWIVLVLALQLTAWTTWLTIASKNRVAEVPLKPRPARTSPADR